MKRNILIKSSPFISFILLVSLTISCTRKTDLVTNVVFGEVNRVIRQADGSNTISLLVGNLEKLSLSENDQISIIKHNGNQPYSIGVFRVCVILKNESAISISPIRWEDNKVQGINITDKIHKNYLLCKDNQKTCAVQNILSQTNNIEFFVQVANLDCISDFKNDSISINDQVSIMRTIENRSNLLGVFRVNAIDEKESILSLSLVTWGVNITPEIKKNDRIGKNRTKINP